MCGICGFTGEIINRDHTRQDVVKSMADVITHRGPDDCGYHVDDDIAMGFRRLSIIDIAEGHQPIYNEDKTLVLTFNGEIYNYQELREELIKAGHQFYTNSDSEVLVHGFEEWQEDMLNKLRGMFGFAIWNTVTKELFIARDFFGIKPMHYTLIGENLVYGSEIKSILEHPDFEKKFNYRTLDNYLSYQYALPPETFFEDLYCLMPGHYLWFRNGKVETCRYWESVFEPDESMTEDEAVDAIADVFENSVNVHKIADVDVGCFLSSGVDSSYVSTYFADQKTFTVGFDFGLKYNEISWAQNLSEKIGVDHHYKIISSDEFWGNIKHVQYHMDQPLADPSCIALYFVSKIASEHVKVVLSGEGADELFGGYQDYNNPVVFKGYRKLPQSVRTFLKNAANRTEKAFKGQGFVTRGELPVQQFFYGNARMFDVHQKRRLLKKSGIATNPVDRTKKLYSRVKHLDDVTQMQYIDINSWMIGDILLKADRMSMANSLELRVPFLDKEVFKVASKIPARLRVNKTETKMALRKAAARRMPIETANKDKLGFPVPTRVWLKDQKYYDIVKKAFNSEIANKFFNTDELMHYLDGHRAGIRDYSRMVWTVYIFIVWYDIYFNGASHDEGDMPIVE